MNKVADVLATNLPVDRCSIGHFVRLNLGIRSLAQDYWNALVHIATHRLSFHNLAAEFEDLDMSEYSVHFHFGIHSFVYGFEDILDSLHYSTAQHLGFRNWAALSGDHH